MKRLPLLLFVALLGACSSVKVSYDIDKSTDFSKFKTYAYTDEALKLPVQELNRNRVTTAIDNEMTARGFTKSSNPDVWIDLQLKTQKKESATAMTTGPGMYGYGRPYMYGGGFSTTQINVSEYIDGTLFINMIADNKLVWQGRGTETLDENATPEKLDKNISSGVAAIFKKYPVQPPAKK